MYKSFHPHWNVPPEYMDAIETLVMFKVMRGDEDVALHFIEVCNDYAYAHPPLYDKKNPELARYSWFNIIKWCCENGIGYLDLDGGAHRSWPDLIKGRLHPGNDTFLNRVVYKWAFIPKDVKDNPDNEPVLYQMRCGCGWKYLGDETTKCLGCNRKK